MPNKESFFKKLARLKISPWLVVAVLAIATILYSAPVSFNPGKYLPGDVKFDPAPLVNTWILNWNLHAAVTDPVNIFDANIFYPNENTLAYSEHYLLYSAAAIPAQLIFNNPVVNYNFIFFLVYVVSGLGVFLYIRYLTKKDWLALLAAIFFTFTPAKLFMLPTFQAYLLFTPFALLFLHKIMDGKHTYKNVLLFALFNFLAFFASGYIGAYTFILYAFYVPLYVWIFRPRKIIRSLLLIFSSLVITGLLLIPTVLPYLLMSKDTGFAKDLYENFHFSLTFDDLVPRRLAEIFGFNDSAVNPHPPVFVGFGLFFLAIVAFFNKQRRRLVWFFTLVGFISIVLSFGPRYQAMPSIILPYELIRMLPGFDFFRMPSRFAEFFILAAAAIAAIGFEQFIKLLRDYPKRFTAALGALLLVIICFEFVSSAERKYYDISEFQKPVYTWIKENKIGPFVELPFLPYQGMKGNGLDEAPRVFASTIHWQKMFNGFSSTWPKDYFDQSEVIMGYPNKSAVDLLKELGVKYVIVDTDAYMRRFKNIKRYNNLKPIYNKDNYLIFNVEKNEKDK